MPAYSHRQRVLAAFNHQEPDRVPLDLMGNATMLLDETYLRLRDHLDLEPIPPVRSGTTANYYDERILEYFDIDFRRLFLPKNPTAKSTVLDDGTTIDPWGVGYRKAGLYVNIVRSPLQGATTVREVEAHNWPTAEELFTTEELAVEARRLTKDTDYALVARNPITFGFLDRACQIMEMSEFMMVLALYPDVARAIIAHLLEIYKDVYGMFLDAVGPYVHMVEIGDDLGSNRSLLISPKMYREFIKPAEQELYALIHEKAPHSVLFRHTDGAVFDVIPDFLEVGVNVLNPVQTSTEGMDARRLKAAYGDALTFHGAIEGLEGDPSVDQVVTEVKDRIDALGPGGGYVLASCNHMIDVRPEIIIAMFETAQSYGQYK
ncbi:MAG: uroporphyrinogen decarboxylase family protein [Chloroflexota bacterium]|nr:uroporphyrinogen decarboxylase family protein [Chloroflexota bacterium]